jgi:flagellar protein FlaG
MQIEGKVAATNQLPVSSAVGREATATGGGGSPASGQAEEAQQQSDLSEGSIVSLLKQDGVLVNFSIDKDTNDFVVKVINPFTNKVIREVPPEEIPKLASSIQQAGGMLVDKHA